MIMIVSTTMINAICFDVDGVIIVLFLIMINKSRFY